MSRRILGPIAVVVITLTYPAHDRKQLWNENAAGIKPAAARKVEVPGPTVVGKTDLPDLRRVGRAVALTPALVPSRPKTVVLPPTLPLNPEGELTTPQPAKVRIPLRLKAVLDLIRYPWQNLGYEVVFLPARPGFRAMTISDRHRIEVYTRAGDQALDLAFDLAHELGHAFDLQHLDEERHKQWCVLRGIKPETPWFGCNRCPDYDTPAGDFAETFAYLLLGPGNYHSRMAPPPKLNDVPKLASFCEINLDGLWCAAWLKAAGQEVKPEPPTSKSEPIR